MSRNAGRDGSGIEQEYRRIGVDLVGVKDFREY